MNDPSANPVWVTLLCIARCVIPLILLIGASYVIRKLGLVAEPPPPPPSERNGTSGSNEEGLVHDRA